MAGTGRDGRAELSAGARARGVVAATLAVLAGLLAPLSLAAGWTWTQLSDTDRFVASYSGLARTPEVQSLVSGKVTAAITTRLGSLGENSFAQRVVADTVSSVVGSDAFAGIWEQTLRTSHTQLRQLLAAEPGAVAYTDGALQLQLQPFAEAAKQRLIAARVPFADRLPTITATVPLVELDPQLVAQARGAYRSLELAASWLPWLALLCGVGAVVLWPNKRRALIVTGAAVGLFTVAFASGWTPLVQLAEAAVPAALRPVASVFFNLAQQPLVSPTLTLAATAAALLFTGLLSARRPAS